MGLGNLQIGETYPYWNYIKSPEDLGITTQGNFSHFLNDVSQLLEYGNLLLFSHSKASTTGNALGSKYFLNTGGQCCPTSKEHPWGGTPCENDALVDRYIFVNTIPTGVLPGVNIKGGKVEGAMTGLLPGILENNFKIPFEIQGLLLAVAEDAHPPCVELELHVIDNKNETSVETHYVASADILGMRPSDFPDNKNPITGRPSTEFFTNLNIQQTDDIFLKDPIILLYFILLIILAIYIFYRLFYFSRKK